MKRHSTNNTMIIHGEEELFVPAHLNFGKFMLDRLRKTKPDDTCLVDCDSGDQLTFGQFTRHAVSLSVSLAELGVGRGDVVAVAGEPRPTFLPTALAVVFTGAAYTPLELVCGRAILTHKLNLTKPKYVICSRLFWEEYSETLKCLDYIKTLICFDEIEDIPLSVKTLASRDVDVGSFEPAAVSGATDVAMVAYSSGTTGMSKGVQLTHLNCITSCNTRDYYDFDKLQTSFLVGDQSCSYFIFLMCRFLIAGKRTVYSDKLVDLQIIQDYKVDTIPTIPAAVEELLNAENADEYDISSLKILYSTSGPIHPKITRAFKERYPNVLLLQWYGSTEVGLISGQLPSHEGPTTVGVAASGVSLKVVDVETRVTLGPNQRGEICARVPSLMKGYLGANMECLDEQGFFLTGDLGYYDDHKCFYVVDRLKDIINYLGFKVSPGELEAVLMRHPAVRDAAVVGKPVGARGEEPAAFVVLQPQAAATEAELVSYVADEVTWYMRLSGGVRFVSELPRSTRGKVLRTRLREMLELK